jgi:hypothetical protein
MTTNGTKFNIVKECAPKSDPINGPSSIAFKGKYNEEEFTTFLNKPKATLDLRFCKIQFTGSYILKENNILNDLQKNVDIVYNLKCDKNSSTSDDGNRLNSTEQGIKDQINKLVDQDRQDHENKKSSQQQLSNNSKKKVVIDFGVNKDEQDEVNLRQNIDKLFNTDFMNEFGKKYYFFDPIVVVSRCCWDKKITINVSVYDGKNFKTEVEKLLNNKGVVSPSVSFGKKRLRKRRSSYRKKGRKSAKKRVGSKKRKSVKRKSRKY